MTRFLPTTARRGRTLRLVCALLEDASSATVDSASHAGLLKMSVPKGMSPLAPAFARWARLKLSSVQRRNE
jgi:hypothetical protein